MNTIIKAAEETFAHPAAPDAPNPYGDGNTAERIAAILEEKLRVLDF